MAPFAVKSLPRPGGEELSLALSFGPGHAPGDEWRALLGYLEARGATIVAQDVFAAPAFSFGLPASPAWPVTWLGDPDVPTELSGTLVTAVTGAAVERLALDGRVLGSVWSDGATQWCRLGGLRPARPGGSPAEQTRETFAQMEALLARAGLAFADVVRTWWFNRDILGWYADFNRVRSAFFQERKVFDGLVPASTGIGAANPAGTALVAGLLALRSADGSMRATALASPLQCPALQYGSSFSRAVELAAPGLRRILVSGSASIAPDGKSAHLGDFPAQVRLTLEVIEAILKSRGAGWGDVVRGVAYLRRAEDFPVWKALAAEHGLAGLPLVSTRTVVCRDDLLFELECDAAVAG